MRPTEASRHAPCDVLSCPFCGSCPHSGPTKAKRDQLHGDAFQRYRIWCPKGHAEIEEVNRDQAIAAWNRRATAQSINAEMLAMLKAARDFIADHSAVGPYSSSKLDVIEDAESIIARAEAAGGEG